MDKSENRREQYRYVRHDKLFVQALASNKKVDVTNVTVFCYSCDASVNGLRVELGVALAINSLVDLWVAFEGVEGKFYLRGHVCWCYEADDTMNLYQTGIELEDAYATDYGVWVELLESFSS